MSIEAILAAWDLAGAEVSEVPVGLINRTLLVERAGEKWILQRLHPVFAAEVNLDIDAITAHLEREGVMTPRPVPTREGALHRTDEEGVWRLLTYVPGRTIERVGSPSLAEEAGRAAGRFHRALLGLDHRFHFTRPSPHDTAKHLTTLRDALVSHRDHPLYAEIREVGLAILSHAEALPAFEREPLRIVHGDLKISNVLFDDALTRAIALVDLDTVAYGSLAIEMGDALRSWCNPRGEDEPRAIVDEAVFDAALRGWLSEMGGRVTAAELGSIVPAFETIALELAARFCADALLDRYFGWDPSRFASRSEHDLLRARSQLAVAEGVRARRPSLEARVSALSGA